MPSENFDLDFRLRATDMASGVMQSFGSNVGGLGNVLKAVGVGAAAAS